MGDDDGDDVLKSITLSRLQRENFTLKIKGDDLSKNGK